MIVIPLGVCVCVGVGRIQPIGLVERIQAIAQNLSDMAVRVEQILQRSQATNRGTRDTHTSDHSSHLKGSCVCLTHCKTLLNMTGSIYDSTSNDESSFMSL